MNDENNIPLDSTIYKEFLIEQFIDNYETTLKTEVSQRVLSQFERIRLIGDEQLLSSASSSTSSAFPHFLSNGEAVSEKEHLKEITGISRPTIAPTLQPANLPTTQINALFEFYNTTNGYNWRWLNQSIHSQPWDFNETIVNPCYNQWQGIVCLCGNTNCELITLQLPAHYIIGPLGTSLTTLTSLQILDLQRNFLTGYLPAELSQLTQLTILRLTRNKLLGTIPIEFCSHFQQLTELDLGANLLNGTIPMAFYNATFKDTLELLFLGANHFIGTIPSNISQFTYLRGFRIKENHFTQKFPFASLSQLFDLTLFDISNNSFTGHLTNQFGYHLNHLVVCNLGQNLFTGSIPNELSVQDLQELRLLSFNRNSFNGSIPDCIGQLTSLQLFSSEFNLHVGKIPSTINQLPYLTLFLVARNQLTGSVMVFQNMTKIRVLDVSHNLLIGKVNESFINFDPSKLNYLGFTLNFFTGYLPQNNWTQIVYYLATGNSFIGTIPDFSMSRFVYDFAVGGNFLTGPFPTWLLASCHGLNYLHVEDNLLTGNIPILPIVPSPTNYHLNQSFLGEFYIYLNYLTGTIPVPHYLSNQTRLVNYQIDHNYFEGPNYSNYLLSLPKLIVFFIQDNFFTGSIVYRNISSSALEYSLLSSVDFSNNLITGSLPSELFLTNIETFAACTNCFEGTLPETLCKGKSLTALALDGLATATACRLPIFPGISTFTSFTLKKIIGGTIPLCLFDLPMMQTLHLSGNGLSGSLPDNVSISPTLTDLSLSHNVLTGSIPNIFQHRDWASLDLSNNKLMGEMDQAAFIALNASTSQLNLFVNRLSGRIPGAITDLLNINILQGNMFSCSIVSGDSSLPNHDPMAGTYDCGSNLTEESLFAFLTIAGTEFLIFLGIYLIYYYYSHRRNDNTLPNPWLPSHHKEALEKEQRWSVIAKIQWIQSLLVSWNHALLDEMEKSPNISFAIHTLYTLQQSVVFITMTIVLFLLPLYGILSMFGSSVTNKYAWTISGAFFTGEIAGLGLLIAFILFLLASNQFINRLFAINLQKPIHLRSAQTTTNNSIDSLPSKRVDSTTEEEQSKNNEFFQYSLIWFLVAILDFVVMILVNVIYILSVVNPVNNLVILLFQFLLAIFKIIWNDLILWKLFPLIQYRMDSWYCPVLLSSPSSSPSSVISGTTSETTAPEIAETSRFTSWKETIFTVLSTDHKLRSNDILLLISLTLFNNIIAPFISIAVITPDCFYYAFFAPDTVQSSYPFCQRFLVIGIDRHAFCLEYSIANTSYQPPYSYGYQCSSQLIINYTSVYIYMFIIVGFIQPLLKIFMNYFCDAYVAKKSKENIESSSSTGEFINHDKNSKNRTDITLDTFPTNRNMQLIEQQENSISSYDDETKERAAATSGEMKGKVSKVLLNRKQYLEYLKTSSLLYMLYLFFVPENLKTLITDEEYSYLLQKQQRQQPPPSSQLTNRYSNSRHHHHHHHHPLQYIPEIMKMRRLFVRIFAWIGILVSFGALFPPLAVIAMIAVLVIIAMERFLLGRILYKTSYQQTAAGSKYQWYQPQIEKECEGLHEISKKSNVILFSYAALLFGYLVFDTFGDKYGWTVGIAPGIAVALFPFLLWTMSRLRAHVFSSRMTIDPQEGRIPKSYSEVEETVNTKTIGQNAGIPSEGGVEMRKSLSLPGNDVSSSSFSSNIQRMDDQLSFVTRSTDLEMRETEMISVTSNPIHTSHRTNTTSTLSQRNY